MRKELVYICCDKDMRIKKISLFSSAALERICRPCKIKNVKNQRKAWSGVHRITHPASAQGEGADDKGGGGRAVRHSSARLTPYGRRIYIYQYPGGPISMGGGRLDSRWELGSLI